MQPRYDEEKGIYRDCKFCGGTGCLACKGEASKAYRKAFPDGPQPIASFKKDSPDDMERFKKVFGASALNKAFGDGGGGMVEILKNLADSSRNKVKLWAREVKPCLKKKK